jgi:hypothetical protein
MHARNEIEIQCLDLEMKASAEQHFRRLFALLSPRRHGFVSRASYMGFKVEKVAV